jgi:hypothetical protein
MEESRLRLQTQRVEELEKRRRLHELHEGRCGEELQQRLRRQELQHRQRPEELEQQLREVATDLVALEAEAAAAEAEDEDDIDWSDDGPDPKEKVVQQRAIVESFESQKKLQDDVHVREEDNDERWRCAVDLSI